MILHGTVKKILADGTEAACDVLIDQDSGQIIQVGGDTHIDASAIDLLQVLAKGEVDE